MIKSDTSDIIIPVNIDFVFNILTQLTNNKKKEVIAFLQHSLQKEEKSSINHKLNNKIFLESELGSYIKNNSDNKLDIDEIRKGLSTIKNSLANDVNKYRKER